jgi:hypothetical protein
MEPISDNDGEPGRGGVGRGGGVGGGGGRAVPANHRKSDSASAPFDVESRECSSQSEGAYQLQTAD